MKKDIILCGVGGQGILSIATIIGEAATKAGLYLKQAEVHGMSQRGGDGIDLIIGALPVVLRAEALQPLDHDASVPGAVKNADVAAAGQTRPEAPEILAVFLVRLRRGDGHYVEAARVQRLGDAADIAALARGVPALVAEYDRDLLAVDDVVQLGQPLLQLFEFFFVFLVCEGGSKHGENGNQHQIHRFQIKRLFHKFKPRKSIFHALLRLSLNFFRNKFFQTINPCPLFNFFNKRRNKEANS